ncbi:hypothetical protein DER44DRAFT_794201 [Fusarium oxysporum]|nr:hypothetical protein DER44DRAFT_794201 [Fusarium oxysporum]
MLIVTGCITAIALLCLFKLTIRFYAYLAGYIMCELCLALLLYYTVVFIYIFIYTFCIETDISYQLIINYYKTVIYSSYSRHGGHC